MKKIILGTAQFGMDYGITNHFGVTNFEEVGKILEYAKQVGVDTLDTAPSYGRVECVLGCLDIESYKIITKTPHFMNVEIEDRDIDKLKLTFANTLKNLNKQSLEAIFLHNVNDVYKVGIEKVLNQLLIFKQDGLVRKIGISVYEPKDITKILSMPISIDILQVPINVFNQDMDICGILDELKSRDIEVHVRSIFLQGILLEDIDFVDRRFVSVLEHYFDELEKYKLSKLEAALLYIEQLNSVDKVVIGVNSIEQFKSIIYTLEKIKDLNIPFPFLKFNLTDKKIIDPREW